MSYSYKDFWKNTSFGSSPEHNYDEMILNVLEPGSVLDVGCGAGRFVETLSDKHAYVGIDISKNAISRAQQDYPTEVFHVGDIVTYTPPMGFDNIFTWTTLEHIPPEYIKKVAKKLTKLGSNLVVCEPQHEGELAEHCFSHNYEKLFKVVRKYDIGPAIIYKIKGDR